MTDARTATPPSTPRERMPLHWKIAIGFVAGLAIGLAMYMAGFGGLAPAGLNAPQCAGDAAPWTCTPWVELLSGSIGQLFLNLIFMLVVPLLFSALVIGVSDMGDVRSFGRIGWRTLGYTVLMSAIAVLIGLVLVNVLKPGAGVDPALAQQMLSENAERAKGIVEDSAEAPVGLGLLMSIVPSNVVKAAADGSVLAVMFFALLLGLGLVLTPGRGTEALRAAIQGLFDVSMTLIGLVIRLAPYAVFVFMLELAATFGWELLGKLAGYVAVVVLALALHLVVSYGIALRLAGYSPLRFFRDVQEAMLLAFSTASSNATLPTSLRVADTRLGLPPKISRFVLTVGATANQNGTALFEGVTVIFLAQFFGVDLTLGQQALVMLVCILGGIGTAGVPSGSLPVVAMICAMVGIRPEGIALILGVNHFLDMCRTTLNVTGDLAIATLVSRGESEASTRALPASAVD